jgi:hypothetical protein
MLAAQSVAQSIVPIDVSVTVDQQVVCSPDIASVSVAQSVLVFRLQTDGYTFPTSEAVVVADPGTQFPNKAKTLTPTRVSLLDCCTEAGSFEYTIYVVQTATGQTYNCDPIIQNQP